MSIRQPLIVPPAFPTNTILFTGRGIVDRSHRPYSTFTPTNSYTSQMSSTTDFTDPFSLDEFIDYEPFTSNTQTLGDLLEWDNSTPWWQMSFDQVSSTISKAATIGPASLASPNPQTSSRDSSIDTHRSSSLDETTPPPPATRTTSDPSVRKLKRREQNRVSYVSFSFTFQPLLLVVTHPVSAQVAVHPHLRSRVLTLFINRQQAYRDRQKKVVEDLEQSISQLLCRSQAVEEENGLLKRELGQVMRDNQELRTDAGIKR